MAKSPLLKISLFTILLLTGVASANASPAAKEARFDAVVSADSSGTHTNLQAAINAAPDHGTNAFRILIKSGTYEGQFIVPKGKRHVQLVGEDLTNTFLTYALNVKETNAAAIPQFKGTGVIVLADDFSAERIPFRNTSGDHGQAPALRVDGDRAVFKHCRMLGWQDTLMLNNGRYYFQNCHIEGRVDFIYGSATAWFDQCRIHSKNGGYVTAASTPPERHYGFVFTNCKLTGDPAPWVDASGNPVKKSRTTPLAALGRPWQPTASVTFLNCEMGPHIAPAGWDNWRKPEREKTSRFAEYGSHGPGANPGKRAPWSKQLTQEEANAITPEAVLGGTDGWRPNSKTDSHP